MYYVYTIVFLKKLAVPLLKKTTMQPDFCHIYYKEGNIYWEQA